MKDINRLTSKESGSYGDESWLAEPLDECDDCGADLFAGVRHDCPVTGTWVIVEPAEE